MSNYVYCSHEPDERLYRVYDSDGEVEPLEIPYPKGSWQEREWARDFAEGFALIYSRRLGCEWGTNYP
jgi:hypothetical protein